MTAISYTLPLSDIDRANLRFHAASVGKSPIQSDQALIDIYNGTTPAAGAPAPSAAGAAAVSPWRVVGGGD